MAGRRDFVDRRKTTFVCQSDEVAGSNLNAHITDALERMIDTYKQTKDNWRTHAYTKAVTALRRCVVLRFCFPSSVSNESGAACHTR
jgi:hypothetical protein